MGGSVFSRISSPWAIERAIRYKLSNATHRLFELTEFVIGKLPVLNSLRIPQLEVP